VIWLVSDQLEKLRDDIQQGDDRGME